MCNLSLHSLLFRILDARCSYTIALKFFFEIDTYFYRTIIGRPPIKRTKTHPACIGASYEKRPQWSMFGIVFVKPILSAFHTYRRQICCHLAACNCAVISGNNGR